MYETSKALNRRLFDSRFATRYFIGDGIDVGSGPDPLGRYTEQFPLMNSCRPWDMADGDAQYLDSIADESLDFVHSSHCLEHMMDPHVALTNWIRVLKPGGYLVVTVPDEDLYEQGVFPSTFNDDHKWTFTIFKFDSWSPKSINLLTLLSSFAEIAQIIKVEQLDAGYRFKIPRSDQTLASVTESAVEFILRKSTQEDILKHGRLPGFLPVTKKILKGDTSLPVIFDSMKYSADKAEQLALEQYRTGNFYEAEAIYLQLTQLDVVSAELFKNYGNTLLYLKKHQEAEQAYRKALELKPDYAEAYNNLGNVLRIEGRWNESELAFKEALRLLPDSGDIHNNYGTLLMDICEYELAEKAFRQAILLKPDQGMFYLNRGNALRAQGRFGIAIKSYRKALELDSVSLDVHINIAQTLLYHGDTDEAEKFIMKALDLYPGNERPYITLGNLYVTKGLSVDAEAAYLRAIAIKPNDPAPKYSLSILKLLLGDLHEGFKLYEHRFLGGSISSFGGTNDMFRALKDKVRWYGEQVADKTLLVITEQGAGDSLMMVRYLPLLKQRGFKRLQVYCDGGLVRLFQTLSVVDEVFSRVDPLDLTCFDYYCPLMSSPYLCQTSLDSIPAAVPYLEIHDAELGKWRTLLEGVSGLKVGMVWAGSSINLLDKQRSIPICEFTPLTAIEGVDFISLQKGEKSGQFAELDKDCIDYMEMCHDYLDTAALIMELDLVISVDTSVAHLAGALGKPVWLMNRFGSEWRWMLNREDSPWYPTMRIFNQEEPGNWTPVIEDIAIELKRLLGNGNNISEERL
jgi:tetratricopeptide (TPR) repeat protein